MIIYYLCAINSNKKYYENKNLTLDSIGNDSIVFFLWGK